MAQPAADTPQLVLTDTAARPPCNGHRRTSPVRTRPLAHLSDAPVLPLLPSALARGAAVAELGGSLMRCCRWERRSWSVGGKFEVLLRPNEPLGELAARLARLTGIRNPENLRLFRYRRATPPPPVPPCCCLACSPVSAGGKRQQQHQQQ